MAGLGRTVLARQRMSRFWGIGDRTNPVSKTPGIVVSDDELISYGRHFSTSSDGSIPRVSN